MADKLRDHDGHRRVEAHHVQQAALIRVGEREPLLVMATTTAFASGTSASRYGRRACAGWISSAHLSLSV